MLSNDIRTLLGANLKSVSFSLGFIRSSLHGSDGKASACNVGDPGSILGLGRSPGEGNGNPLQYCCLDNSMDGGALWATVHGVAKSRIQLSDFTSLIKSLCALLISGRCPIRVFSITVLRTGMLFHCFICLFKNKSAFVLFLTFFFFLLHYAACVF